MGRTGDGTRVERPIYEAWIGASRQLYDYVLWLEDRVKRLEDERIYSAQLQADELRRRDRVITEKDLELSRLEQENRLLRERLRLSSRTSSKPPSTDPPSAPTRVALADLTESSPANRWLTVEGGGLYLPGMMIDTKRSKTGGSNVRTYYVPLLSPDDAAARLAQPSATTQPTREAFVKFDGSDFESQYPSSGTIPRSQAFRPLTVTGMRTSLPMFNSQVSSYVSDQLHLPDEAVTVIAYNERPVTRLRAAIYCGIALLLLAASGLWILYRWTWATPSPR